MGDVELYASYISAAIKGLDTFKGAILVGTLLVGYFTACKSLLDAGAVTLAKVYNLPLTNKEMDFSKPKFWRQVEDQMGPVIRSRYYLFKNLFDEIIKWRDAAVHRLTPLVVTHSPGPPDEAHQERLEIKMAAQPDADISTVAASGRKIQWVQPLHHHGQWENQLLEFCKEVCLDIRNQVLPGA